MGPGASRDSGVGQGVEGLDRPWSGDELGEPWSRGGGAQDEATFLADQAATQVLAGEAPAALDGVLFLGRRLNTCLVQATPAPAEN